MYVWRQRTRRDRGKSLLEGEYGWGCGKGDTNNLEQDDELQYKDEKKHVEYFRETVRAKMHQYLNTEAGENEIKALAKIFNGVNLHIDKKKAIYSIFRFLTLLVSSMNLKQFVIVCTVFFCAFCLTGSMMQMVQILSNEMN